jgi:hypothetical protein
MVLPTQSEAGGFVLARFYAHSVTKTGGLLAVLCGGKEGWACWRELGRAGRDVEETARPCSRRVGWAAGRGGKSGRKRCGAIL